MNTMTIGQLLGGIGAMLFLLVLVPTLFAIGRYFDQRRWERECQYFNSLFKKGK